MLNEKHCSSNYINIIQSPIKPMNFIPFFVYLTIVTLFEVFIGVMFEFFFPKSNSIFTIEYIMYIIIITLTMQILSHLIIILIACFKEMYIFEIIANLVVQLLFILVIMGNYSLLLKLDSTSNYKYFPLVSTGIFTFLQGKQIFNLKKKNL